MSNLESTWSLNCNGTPRSLAVYPTPPIPIASMRSTGNTGGSTVGGGGGTNSTTTSNRMNAMNATGTNPFDTRVRNPFGSGPTNTRSGAGGGGNPFDVASSSSNSPSSLKPPNTTNPFGMASTNAAAPLSSTSNNSPSSLSSFTSTSSGSMMKSTYSVIFGTDRGTLHYRTYPNTTKNNSKIGNVALAAMSPIGLEMNNNSKLNMGGLHPVYLPLDIQQLQQARGQYSIVTCIRAEPPSSILQSSKKKIAVQNANINNNATTTQHHEKQECHNPLFLILQDDKQSDNSLHANSRSSITSSIRTNDDHSTSNNSYNHNNTSSTMTKTYAANLITLHQYDRMNTNNKTTPVVLPLSLPRISSVSYHELAGFVYTIGSSIYSLPPNATQIVSSSFTGENNVTTASSTTTTTTATTKFLPKLYYHCTNALPSCGVRSGYGGISMICNGHVVVIAMKNGSFYAVNGMSVQEGFWTLPNNHRANTNSDLGQDNDDVKGYGEESKGDVEKMLSFRQASPVYPAISIEIPLSDQSSTNDAITVSVNDDNGGSQNDGNNDVYTSLVFLASGRECAVVEVLYNPKLYSNNRYSRMDHHTFGQRDSDDDMKVLPSPSINCGSIVVGSPRHGIATLASPILAAVGLKPMGQSPSRPSSTSASKTSSCTPLVVILTSDGLLHTRSPSFISIPLSTIEVGNRPNDFFTLQALPDRKVVAGSYSGEARLISFREDTMQDLADRLVKLSIDAFGTNGFPRAELAEAIGATFSATSYIGAEPSLGARNMLKQYLETCLGLDMSGDFGGAALYKQFLYGDDFKIDDDENNYENSQSVALASSFAASYLSATAILCLVCTRLGTPNPSLANRAAKSSAAKFGLVGKIQQTGINASTVKVCELVAEVLLDRSESTRTLPASGGLATGRDGIQMEMVEAASWLLRSCGKHERAIEILQERMNNPATRNKMYIEDSTEMAGDKAITKYTTGWSQSKYDKHICSHLEELWSFGDKVCQDLVLKSKATRRLLETNPSLGLRIFTALLPQNEKQWIMQSTDPLLHTKKAVEVVEMLKTIVPKTNARKSPIDVGSMSIEVNNDFDLPLDSGRSLAVSYLETGIGIATGRPATKNVDDSEEILIEIHNELAFLLLEGVLTERLEGDKEIDTDVGKLYREKLRRLLGWHSSRVQPDQIMDALPTSFLREKALLYGQLGRHEDALRIFYLDLKSLDLALEYCDARYEKQQSQNRYQMMKAHSGGNMVKANSGCAYLPLVRVVLESDQDSERGIAAAIKVLSLRRENIDRAAALRLLPKNIPVSALAQSFLIPALIDGESQARRLTVTASLLRAKYNRLKYSLTEAQIKSQSILQNVPALQSLNLGQPVHVSKTFKARPSNMASLHFPDVLITKHFFQRYVVIQATATSSNGMTLGDLKFVVAESSDEALLPSVNVPIKTLPPRITGSSWCVLAASPQRLDGTAILVCEMHYNILSYDDASNSYHFENGLVNGQQGRLHVEEIQDIEIRRSEFEG